MITIPDGMRRPAEAERDELKKQLAEARAEIKRLNKNMRLLLCEKCRAKCEGGLFNSKYPEDEPCLICELKKAEK